jgi:hypothetical protein
MENLLKSHRQVLHRRVGEALRDNLAAAAAEPEVLAHHFTQAGLTEALGLIATLPGTPALRREQIRLQVARKIATDITRQYGN